jgi:lipoic acid synthetase
MGSPDHPALAPDWGRPERVNMIPVHDVLTPDPSAPLPFKHRRPDWLRVRAPWGNEYERVRGLMREQALHTVCEEARCPNIGECWGAGTATFLILGDVCTRSCGFCAIKTGRPVALDVHEPERVARSIQTMGVRHAVITSVNRDELPDGGAAVFARCITRSRELSSACSLEVLIPDFRGDRAALEVVMSARPEILNHNLETVPRLYRTVRPQAIYRRSLDVLAWAKEMDPTVLTKTGIMVGLGEDSSEIEQLIDDVAAIGVDILTIGQYLRPSESHIPIARYVDPAEFDRLRDYGLTRGIAWVESGPLVRSSYRAEQQVAQLSKRRPRAASAGS